MHPIFYGRLLPYTDRHLLPVRTLLTAPLVILTTPVIPVHLALLALTIPIIHPVHPVLSVHLTGAVGALEEVGPLVAGNIYRFSLSTIVGLARFLSLLPIS